MEDQINRSSLDFQALQLLVDLSHHSGTDLVIQVIKLFQTEGEDGIKAIRLAVNRNDFSRAVKIAHALKSSAANVGAMRVRDLASEIERAKPEAITVMNLLTLIELEFAAATKELQDYSKQYLGDLN